MGPHKSYVQLNSGPGRTPAGFHFADIQPQTEMLAIVCG